MGASNWRKTTISCGAAARGRIPVRPASTRVQKDQLFSSQPRKLFLHPQPSPTNETPKPAEISSTKLTTPKQFPSKCSSWCEWLFPQVDSSHPRTQGRHQVHHALRLTANATRVGPPSAGSTPDVPKPATRRPVTGLPRGFASVLWA